LFLRIAPLLSSLLLRIAPSLREERRSKEASVPMQKKQSTNSKKRKKDSKKVNEKD
jgi:hypothetical protein